MGRVVITHINQGDARGVARVNANFDAIEAQTVLLGATNYRPEGFDYQSLSTDALVEDWFTRLESSPIVGTQTPGATWVTLTPSGYAFSVADPPDLGVGEVGVVRFRGQFVSLAGPVHGIPANSTVQLRIRVDDDAAGVSMSGIHHWTTWPANAQTACVSMLGLFTGDGSALTNLRIEIRGTAATQFQFGYGSMVGRRYKV